MRISATPPDAPVLSINDNAFTGEEEINQVTVVEGLQTSLGCEVIDGDHAADISLVCDGVKIPWKGFIFTRHQDGKLCTCSADHFTGCYKKTTSVQLQIACESVLVQVIDYFYYKLSDCLFVCLCVTELLPNEGSNLNK